MDFTLSECIDKEYWDHFIDSSPQGNIFCRTAFLDSLDIGYQLWCVKQGKELCLGAVMLKDETGQFIRSTYMFCMYQGILFSQAYLKSQVHNRIPEGLGLVDFLLSELEKRYNRISFCLHTGFKDLRSLLWFHYHEPEYGQFRIDLRYTGLIDLKAQSTFEAYLSAIRKTRRYEYNKALKQRLKMEISNDVDKLDYLHDLTFERQGIKRKENAGKVLKGIAATALSQGFGELLFCKNNTGEVIAATLYLYDKHCGYYLFGANHPDYRSTGAGTFLMLENIRICQGHGLGWVDVCGINSPNRGDFKVSFNAMPVPYFEVFWER